MNEDVFWKILDEVLNFGEFVVAIPNVGASANIVGKISIGRDGRERVIDKDICHCHVHLKPEKVSQFSFIYIDAGFGDEPACELKTLQDEIVLRLYLRGSKENGKICFATFSHKDSEFVKGNW